MEIQNRMERVLGELGLAKRRRSFGSFVAPALGVFAAGILIGGALGLLFAPKSGRELRGDLQSRVKRTVEKAPNGSIDIS